METALPGDRRNDKGSSPPKCPPRLQIESKNISLVVLRNELKRSITRKINLESEGKKETTSLATSWQTSPAAVRNRRRLQPGPSCDAWKPCRQVIGEMTKGLESIKRERKEHLLPVLGKHHLLHLERTSLVANEAGDQHLHT